MPSWSEKELEDWLWQGQNLWDMLADHYIHRGDKGFAYRQVKTPVGTIDILAQCDDGVVVIELKSVDADGNALAQVLDYRAWVRERYEQLLPEKRKYRSESEEAVSAVLVAPSFQRRTAHAAEETGVACIVAKCSFLFDYGPEGLADYNPLCADVDGNCPYDQLIVDAICAVVEPDTDTVTDENVSEEEPNEQVGETAREDQ